MGVVYSLQFLLDKGSYKTADLARGGRDAYTLRYYYHTDLSLYKQKSVINIVIIPQLNNVYNPVTDGCERASRVDAFF